MNSKIISIATAVPEYGYKTEEIVKYIENWLVNQPKRFQRKAIKIFEGTQIKQKFGILPIEKIFIPMSFEEKNNHYIDSAIELGAKVLEKALKKASLLPEDIDYIITTSCTGYMIPSFDAHLINMLGLRQNIHRLPVTEMGCAGGAAALIYADHFLKAYPDKIAAVISVEAPSITFQHNDFSIDNIVGSAIFADGAACVILGPCDKLRPQIIDTQMFHFPDTVDILGFNLTNSGFKIVLKEQIPAKISENFGNIVYPFLNKNNLSLEDIDSFIFHPGGKKITMKIEELLGQYNKEITESKSILSQYGNMSSATILFILEKFMQKKIPDGKYGLILSFGPGFTAQTLLLRWN